MSKRAEAIARIERVQNNETKRLDDDLYDGGYHAASHERNIELLAITAELLAESGVLHSIYDQWLSGNITSADAMGKIQDQLLKEQSDGL